MSSSEILGQFDSVKAAILTQDTIVRQYKLKSGKTLHVEKKWGKASEGGWDFYLLGEGGNIQSLSFSNLPSSIQKFFEETEDFEDS